ncbi:hypothetical protein [Humisphaera borealis]|uniref:Uncharacterized protein n=1 Tax=Humisphaera borealis TaxID=2807512 RepID=A0A7M2X3S8_9BACT|nr:hypothetical protein [Humisphaera borealis]QOV91671.1 hypothetical protein IPV69_10030 [Humisphaera borealis]
MESRKSFPLVALLMLIGALTISVVLIGLGIYRVAVSRDWIILSAGALGVVVTLVAWAAIAASGSAASAENHAVVDGRLDMISDRLFQAVGLLSRISEQQLISDRAKSVAFREKDRDAIRRAIQEDINRGDFDAALRLSDEFESAFGYRAEAAKFRDEVRGRRQDQVRRQIQEVVEVIDRHTRSEQWNGALREAERLMSMFPDNDQVRGLPLEIDRRRQEYKKRLLESWQEAVARHDTDGSIEILRQLDAYLTPAEASGMEESVRQVFKERRDQLAKLFGDAVRDHKWPEAIRAGETIIAEFPESRMAQEVREKMPVLRQQANGVSTAAAVAAGV